MKSLLAAVCLALLAQTAFAQRNVMTFTDPKSGVKKEIEIKEAPASESPAVQSGSASGADQASDPNADPEAAERERLRKKAEEDKKEREALERKKKAEQDAQEQRAREQAEAQRQARQAEINRLQDEAKRVQIRLANEYDSYKAGALRKQLIDLNSRIEQLAKAP